MTTIIKDMVGLLRGVTEMEEEMCERCVKRPVLEGKNVCSECLKNKPDIKVIDKELERNPFNKFLDPFMKTIQNQIGNTYYEFKAIKFSDIRDKTVTLSNTNKELVACQIIKTDDEYVYLQLCLRKKEDD